MAGSRRFLLLLLLACVTCVVVVQVTMDGWNLGNSFSYGMHNDQKDLQETETEHMEFRRKTLGKQLLKLTWNSDLVSRQEQLQEISKKSNAIEGEGDVDSMKSLQTMPVVNPNKVTKIIILTYFRAGSSFLGDLLQQNLKTFYYFEPLHTMTYNSRIGDDKIEKAFDLFDGIFSCNFFQLKDFAEWKKQPLNEFIFDHNLFLRAMCHGDLKICFNQTFVNAVCRRAPAIIMKVTRLHMHHLRTYLERNPDMNIKVVYLTRDPRGIVSSRWSMDWCKGTECSNPNALCHEMSEDLRIFEALRKEKPSDFIKVQYEDLSLNPEAESQKLFQFLQLPFSTTVQEFIKTHTVRRTDNNPYSTRRNTKAMAFSWKKRFTFQQVLDVQEHCEEVLVTLNHSMIKSPEQLPFPYGKIKPVI